jgi:hypothetical protein
MKIGLAVIDGLIKGARIFISHLVNMTGIFPASHFVDNEQTRSQLPNCRLTANSTAASAVTILFSNEARNPRRRPKSLTANCPLVNHLGYGVAFGRVPRGWPTVRVKGSTHSSTFLFQPSLPHPYCGRRVA